MIKATLFNAAFYIWTAISAILYIPALLLPKRYLLDAQWRWGRDINWLMGRIAGIEVEIRGRENLPDTPCIIASKHQSAWDTVSWLNIVRAPAIVLKSDLVWIPVYGVMCIKAGMIIVNRKGQSKALKKMIVDGQHALDEGRHIVIFPQGTRTAPDDDTTEKPYQIGIAALYNGLDVPVTPVALNSGLFWPRRSWQRHPGKIVVEFLEPIPSGMKRKIFMRELEEKIETATARLVAEGREGIA
jgi:1-acyl-sn-glycerol-3-phosphate acyltransferase